MLRTMQMSDAQLVVLTEGRLDRLFVSGILSVLDSGPNLKTAVRTARELTAVGGKNALLSFHDYLRRRKQLQSRLGDKVTRVVFFLDKDIDDMCRRLRRSRFITYTTRFDVEAHLFAHGDIVTAVAAATTLTPTSVAMALDPVGTWKTRVAESWLDWVAVCVWEQKRRVSVAGNYGICPSPLHSTDGRLLVTAAEERLAAIRDAAGDNDASFRRRWRRERGMVSRLFQRGEEDRIFKGKWYAWFVERDLRNALPSADADLSALERRLPQHLYHTLDFRASWAEPFVEAFQQHAVALVAA